MIYTKTQKQEILEKWQNEDWFNCEDDYFAVELACMLENQKYWCEYTKKSVEENLNKSFKKHSITINEDDEEFKTLFEEAFQKQIDTRSTMSDDKQIELVYKVFEDIIAKDVVSVQTMLRPADLINFRTVTAIETEDIVAKSRKLQTKEPKEKVNIDKLAKDIQTEITREIFTDLRNNVGTVEYLKIETNYFEDLYLGLIRISGVIHRKTSIGHTDWIVTSPYVADKILKEHEEQNDEIYRAGKINSRWRVIVDKKAPNDEILIGCHDPKYALGYCYAPYIPFSSHNGQVLPRYGKKLGRKGSNFYGKITIEE